LVGKGVGYARFARDGFLAVAASVEPDPTRQDKLVERRPVRTLSQPVKLSEHCTAWRAEDIRALIKQLSEQTPRNN